MYSRYMVMSGSSSGCLTPCGISTSGSWVAWVACDDPCADPLSAGPSCLPASKPGSDPVVASCWQTGVGVLVAIAASILSCRIGLPSIPLAHVRRDLVPAPDVLFPVLVAVEAESWCLSNTLFCSLVRVFDVLLPIFPLSTLLLGLLMSSSPGIRRWRCWACLLVVDYSWIQPGV